MKMKKCPDCGGEFEKGAIMDFTYGGVSIERFAKTEIPKGQKFVFSKESNFENIRRVITYRCSQCNRLFSYAQDEVLGKSIYSAQRKQYYWVLILVVIIIAVVAVIGLIFS